MGFIVRAGAGSNKGADTESDAVVTQYLRLELERELRLGPEWGQTLYG
jgi:hypothetical protein